MSTFNKFGTFKGVFTPSILTILGVIMYMRLPMIVGNSGLLSTIGIIIIAHIIAITTGLSVSSIATDKKVEAGGTYFMISRSLGLPIGGTLGLALFVGLSFSVSLYLIGFSESFLSYWDFEVTKDSIRIAGTIILLVVTILTLLSTSLVLKTQYLIMALIILSLVSIFFGNHEYVPTGSILTNTKSTIPLMVLFGIFFPAVTGFEAGVSMSGDLKDPKKSIPLGTIGAIAVGLVVYIILAFFLAYTVNQNTLANDSNVLLKISWIPELVIAGIWGATISSAFGSILGAPRILQATSIDKITPKFFGKGYGKTNEPRNALILTFVIAEAGILIGELDIIARIVSIFFITTYGFLNLSNAFESLTSADFRPSFKSPVWVSLLGAAASMIIMIQLDLLAMVGASMILIFLFTFLKRKELTLQSGDAWSSIWTSIVKSGLLRLAKTKSHSRNWQPNIILFNGPDDRRSHLIELGKNLADKFGMISGFEISTSDFKLEDKSVNNEDIKPNSEVWLTKKHYSSSIYGGMDEIARSYGYQGLHPNTILMGWNSQNKNRPSFVDFINRIEKYKLNALLFKYKPQEGFKNYSTIDIWWNSNDRNLALAINLVRHLTASSKWKNAKVRINTVVPNSDMVEMVYNSVQNILNNYRVSMEVNIINLSSDRRSMIEIITTISKQTSMTVVGLKSFELCNKESYFDRMDELLSNLDSTLIIHAADTFVSYNLVDMEAQAKLSVETTDGQLEIEIIQTQYPFINEQLMQLEKEGQNHIDTFYNNSIKIIGLNSNNFIEKIKTLSEDLINNISKSGSHEDKYKRLRYLKKLRSNYYYNLKSILNQQLKPEGSSYFELLEDSIRQIQSRFSNTISALPKKVSITLRGNSESESSNKPKEKKLRFRSIMQYVIAQRRIQSLNKHLLEVSNQHQLLFLELSSLIATFETLFNAAANKAYETDNKNEVVLDVDTSLLSKSETFGQEMEGSIVGFRKIMVNDFRHDLQLVHTIIEKKSQGRLANNIVGKKGTIKDEADKLQSFAELFSSNINLMTNSLILKIELLWLMNTLKEEFQEVFQQVKQMLHQGLFKDITKTLANIDEHQNDKQKLLEIKLEMDALLAEKIKTMLDDFKKKVNAIIMELPENIEAVILFQPGISNLSESESVVSVPVQRMAYYLTDVKLFSPLTTHVNSMLKSYAQLFYQTKDSLSLMHFELENIPSDFIDAHYNESIFKKTKTNLATSQTKIKTLISTFGEYTEECITKVDQELSMMKLKETTEELSNIIRGHQSKQGLTKFSLLNQRVSQTYHSWVSKLMYSRIDGMILAREYSNSKKLLSVHERIHQELELKSPEATDMHKLPAYYTNLFSGKSTISKGFWVDRPVEQQQFNKALTLYKQIRKGGIVVVGSRNSGKTTLCRNLTEEASGKNIYHVFPELNGSLVVNEFSKSMEKATGLKGDAATIIDNLPYNSVVVLHDLELWWERTYNGMQLVEYIMDIINQFSHKCLFLVNTNTYFYNFANTHFGIESTFLSTIHCRPFDSEEIKDLVMKRHWSSGISLSYGNKTDDEITELKYARIFNQYFLATRGNPGAVLTSWISNINTFKDNTIKISKPKTIDSGVFDLLGKLLLMVLAQIVLHKRMDKSKLQRVLELDEKKLDQLLHTLQLSGIITERSSGIFVTNFHVNEEIERLLIKKNLI